jgi:iron-sulfur cluster repair protein YtfE (RIC family)
LEHLVILSRALEDTLEKAPKEETFIKVMNRVSEMEEAEQKHHVEQMKEQQKYYKQLLEHLQNNYLQTHNSNQKKLDEMAEAINQLKQQQQSLVSLLKEK